MKEKTNLTKLQYTTQGKQWSSILSRVFHFTNISTSNIVLKVPIDCRFQHKEKHIGFNVIQLIATLLLSQLLLRLTLSTDPHQVNQQQSNRVDIHRSNHLPQYHWWRLVFWRAILQCSVTAIILLGKQLLSFKRNINLGR